MAESSSSSRRSAPCGRDRRHRAAQPVLQRARARRHLLCLAALFLLLRAEFIAAAQVVVYAGAVMVLYVFVVAYIGGDEPEWSRGPTLQRLSILFVGVLVELCIAMPGTGLTALGTEGAPTTRAAEEPFGSPEYIGTLLLTKFLLPFELASILLTVAGGRRRRCSPGAGAAWASRTPTSPA
jgi:NADH:ubiquinone oxidoreductase subunit 6 (subunit J)